MLQLVSSDAWEAFDADCSACSLYRPTGNSGGRFGSSYWYAPSIPRFALKLALNGHINFLLGRYFYPHENMNASCLPSDRGSWPEKAVVKPMFTAPLRAKPVSPITVETLQVATMRKISTGHYAFALKTEVQGGLQLSLSARFGGFDGAQARVLLSEQLKPDGSIRFPMYTGATFASNFSLARVVGSQDAPVRLEHHEYSNWRFGEVIFTAGTGTPLDVTPADFTVSAWVAHYPFETARATVFSSSSTALDSVWALNQNSVKYLGLDMYSDSNARQRSDACQADASKITSNQKIYDCTFFSEIDCL